MCGRQTAGKTTVKLAAVYFATQGHSIVNGFRLLSILSVLLLLTM